MVISKKSCTNVRTMPDMCKHSFEAKVGQMTKCWWGGKAPSQTISIFTHTPSDCVWHKSGIIHKFMQLFIEITIFKWTFEVELLEFLVSTLKSSAEWGKTRSEKPNLIQNSVAKVEWNLPNPLKFESEEISVGKLYFQLAIYVGILVGFGWKVDGQRGQYL